jgi:hypothetical protein
MERKGMKGELFFEKRHRERRQEIVKDEKD